MPPHTKLLVDVGAIKEQQGSIVDKVCTKVMDGLKEHFEERAIGGGELTKARTNNMTSALVRDQFSDLTKASDVHFTSIAECNMQQQGQVPSVEADATRLKAEIVAAAAFIKIEQCPLRTRDGMLTRVPSDFELPKAGMHDSWTKWNTGDTQQGTPHLKSARECLKWFHQCF